MLVYPCRLQDCIPGPPPLCLYGFYSWGRFPAAWIASHWSFISFEALFLLLLVWLWQFMPAFVSSTHTFLPHLVKSHFVYIFLSSLCILPFFARRPPWGGLHLNGSSTDTIKGCLNSSILMSCRHRRRLVGIFGEGQIVAVHVICSMWRPERLFSLGPLGALNVSSFKLFKGQIMCDPTGQVVGIKGVWVNLTFCYQSNEVRKHHFFFFNHMKKGNT